MNNQRRKILADINEDLANKADTESLMSVLEDAAADLEMVRDEEESAYDALPEGIRDGERRVAVSLAIEQLNTALEVIDELMNSLRLMEELTGAIDEAQQ